MLDIFKGELPKLTGKTTDDESKALMALDLVLLLLPFLSTSDANSLFNLCISKEILTAKSNGVQKRVYKILCKLAESQKVPIDAEKVLRELDLSVEELSSAAKKVVSQYHTFRTCTHHVVQDRFNLLAAILPYMPSSALHLIPSMIPEAVLGTKETSDKARSAAFDLLIVMGRKMSQGGVVKRDMLEGMDDDTPMEGKHYKPIYDRLLTRVPFSCC